ncbi:MAG: heparinase II/III family protein [Armatimonadia bacterium]
MNCPDLWGVWSNLERIRENSLRPQFVGWREESLTRLEEGLGKAFEPQGEGTQAAQKACHLAQEMGMGYVLTGEARYAARAVEALEFVKAEGARWDLIVHNEMYPQDTADLMTAENAKACANAVSWVWPELSDEQRKGFIRMIGERGGKPIYEGARAGCWWGNALNSNWTAVLNSGLAFAALMMQKVEPQTAREWLWFARSRCIEMLDLAAQEAAGVEGAGYWLYCFGSLQDVVEALRNVNGDDLYTHPFWGKASRFLPYVALPDFSAWVNYADTAYKGMGGSSFFHGVAARKGDPLAQWYGNEILRRHGGAGWKNVVYYDAGVPEQPVGEEPPCMLFASIQLASMRSGWDDDAVFMLFKGGSNAWSHTHLDLNSFFITGYGERLATEPGPEPYSLAYWHSIQPVVSTAHHNCIVVDGAHQRVPPQYAMSFDLEVAGDCYSRLSDHVSNEWLEMIRGDATTAYGDYLERAWRGVVYLKPDVFVIFDDLVGHPVRCQRNFEWMLHSECELRDIEGGIEARGDKGSLFIQPLFPQGWEHKYVEGRSIPHEKEKRLSAVSIRPYWHHKWNVNPAKSPYPHWDQRGDGEPLYDNNCQYLVVLQVARAGEEPRYALEKLESGTAKGVKLTSAEETVVVVFNHGGGEVEMGGVQTDAEKAVVRVRGEEMTWEMVRGERLAWGKRLV